MHGGMAQQGGSSHCGRASVSFVQNRVWWVKISVAKRQTRVTVTASLLAAMTSESDKVRLQGCVGIVLLIPCSFGSSILAMPSHG